MLEVTCDYSCNYNRFLCMQCFKAPQHGVKDTYLSKCTADSLPPSIQEDRISKSASSYFQFQRVFLSAARLVAPSSSQRLKVSSCHVRFQVNAVQSRGLMTAQEILYGHRQ